MTEPGKLTRFNPLDAATVTESADGWAIEIHALQVFGKAATHEEAVASFREAFRAAMTDPARKAAVLAFMQEHGRSASKDEYDAAMRKSMPDSAEVPPTA